jgi:hypothetical protein
VDQAVELDPAAARLFADAPLLHPARHLHRLLPQAGGGVDVAEEHVVAGLVGVELQQPLAGDLPELDVPVQAARSEQAAPRGHLLLPWLHGRDDPVGLVQPARPAEDVDRSGDEGDLVAPSPCIPYAMTSTFEVMTFRLGSRSKTALERAREPHLAYMSTNALPTATSESRACRSA